MRLPTLPFRAVVQLPSVVVLVVLAAMFPLGTGAVASAVEGGVGPRYVLTEVASGQGFIEAGLVQRSSELTAVAGAASGEGLVARSAVVSAGRSKLVVAPGAPIVGEKVVFTGMVKSAKKVKRPVLLQVKAGKKWRKLVKGKTAKTGAFMLRSRMKATKMKVRVMAPRSGASKPVVLAKTLRAVAQSSTLTGPATTAVGGTVSLSAAFVPARAGRKVVV